MEFLLIIKPEAEKDIQNSIKYYAEQNLKLPVEFLKKLDESLLAIQFYTISKILLLQKRELSNFVNP